MEDVKQQLRYAELTDDEMETALAVAFPVVRQPGIELHLSSLIIHCECGEDTPHAVGAGSQVRVVDCVCGRRWRVSYHIERERGQEPISNPTSPMGAI